ncbi:MAG: hypothetical protein R3B72_49150 [Polyangiaceae bacterium]
MPRFAVLLLLAPLTHAACFGNYAKVTCTRDSDCDTGEECRAEDCQPAAPQACGDASDCQLGCKPCAEAGPCKAVVETCLANPQCVSIDTCYWDPNFCNGDAQCAAQSCDPTYPDGVVPYANYLACVFCQECATVCGTAAFCQ